MPLTSFPYFFIIYLIHYFQVHSFRPIFPRSRPYMCPNNRYYNIAQHARAYRWWKILGADDATIHVIKIASDKEAQDSRERRERRQSRLETTSTEAWSSGDESKLFQICTCLRYVQVSVLIY
jgi:hypothetical protein